MIIICCLYRYNTTWKGMLMVIRGDNLYQLLENELEFIEHVEAEGVVRVSQSIISITTTNITQANPANWGLDRIDHQSTQAIFNNLYTVSSGGSGVHIYVIDTVCKEFKSCYIFI